QPGAARARHLHRAVQHRLRPDHRDPGTDLLALLPRPRGRVPPGDGGLDRAFRPPPAQRAQAMNFRPRGHRDEPEINLIPFIDILLVVVIFLVLTTTYS